MTLAYVEWVDAANQQGPVTLDEMQREVILRSAGILVAECDRFVTLALDHYPEDQTWRFVEHIPRGMIVRMETFPVPDATAEPPS